MARHTLMVPDRSRGRELRSIIWDNEKGTVEGYHSDVPYFKEAFVAPKPFISGGPSPIYALDDPAHDPRDFWVLLIDVYWPMMDEPLRSTLPEILRNTEPRQPEPNGPDDPDPDNLPEGVHVAY